MTLAVAHERATCELIRGCGWRCEPFGQALLSSEMRDALRRTKSPIRWIPDLIASNLEIVMLVDAKSETRHDTPNFSIEKAAHDAHLRWWAIMGVPVLYVWADFRVQWANDLHPTITGPWHGYGSGTPYWLIPKAKQLPFDSVFGRHVTLSA